MDLSPPRTLNDTLHLLRNIFDCHDSSILSIEERHADLAQVRTIHIEYSFNVASKNRTLKI